MNKWVCTKCGREVYEKPHRNAVCNSNGCKGRFKHYRKCDCGVWFHDVGDVKYCSNECKYNSLNSKIRKPLVLTCANCGGEFVRASGNIKKIKQNHFCSKGCFKQFNNQKRIERRCVYCGKTFVVLKSRMSEKTNSSCNFCGRECYNAYLTTLTGDKNKSYKRVEKECPTCGKKIKVIPSKDNDYKNNFCSVKCRGDYMYNYIGGELNKNWLGGTSHYRGDFEHRKHMYFKEKQKCAVCGVDENIHIHHIIPYRLTQDNSKENLVPLCARHHKIIEIKTVELLRNRSDYANAVDEIKSMIERDKIENYQNEVV